MPALDSKYNILTSIFMCRVSHGLGHNTQCKGGHKDGGCPHYEVLLKSDTFELYMSKVSDVEINVIKSLIALIMFCKK